MSTPQSIPSTDVIVAFASRHGATRGVAERIAARLHDAGLAVIVSRVEDIQETVRPVDYRVFAGVILRHQWPLPSRMLFHAFGGRLGDNRDWAAIDAWAEEIALAFSEHREPAGVR